MADGYALIEFDLNGESRIKEVKFFDIQLDCCDFENDDICSWLEDQLPQQIKDSLVLATFKYKSIETYHHEVGTEYEDSFNLITHSIVKQNYKEFYKSQVNMELHMVDGVLEQEGDNYYKELVADWEEFYGEDFKYEPNEKKKALSDVDKLFDIFS